jgi:hypothetical protein
MIKHELRERQGDFVARLGKESDHKLGGSRGWYGLNLLFYASEDIPFSWRRLFHQTGQDVFERQLAKIAPITNDFSTEAYIAEGVFTTP